MHTTPRTPTDPAPAPAARVASPRGRTALAAAAGLVAVALVAVPAAALVWDRGDADVVTAPSGTGGPDDRPAAATPPTTVPGDLSLTSGWPATQGDGSPVTTDEQPGLVPVELCGVSAWSPGGPVPTTDVAGATYRGEAEDSRGRALAVYASEADAASALRALRAGIEGCPSETFGGTEQVREVRSAGADGLVMTHRYRGDAGFDVGLEVVTADRVGNALLLVTSYGEGGATPAGIAAVVADVQEETAPVLADLCVFTQEGC